VETYAPRAIEQPPLFQVGADLNLTLLRAAQPAEQLVLEQIATELADGRCGLAEDAILAIAADTQEFKRVRGFLEDSVEGAAPPELRELLDGIEQRATALADAGPAWLIQCRDVAVANLLSTDPATGAHCTRAGERQLCVPTKKLAAFRKGLGKLGSVLPEVGY
jgi:hypothetical protein